MSPISITAYHLMSWVIICRWYIGSRSLGFPPCSLVYSMKVARPIVSSTKSSALSPPPNTEYHRSLSMNSPSMDVRVSVRTSPRNSRAISSLLLDTPAWVSLRLSRTLLILSYHPSVTRWRSWSLNDWSPSGPLDIVIMDIIVPASKSLLTVSLSCPIVLRRFFSFCLSSPNHRSCRESYFSDDSLHKSCARVSKFVK